MIPVFFANQPDDNHCLQASMLMVFKSLGIPMSWAKINKLTQYDERYYSWTIVAATLISQAIPGTKFITPLDYKKFAKEGKKYLQSIWSEKWYESQKAHASPNFKREQQFAKEFKGEFDLRDTKVSSEEISTLLKNNLIIALINPFAVKGELGFAGHFVVLFDDKNSKFIYHDPGNPPIESAEANHEIFIQASKGEFLIIPKS
jgi:hypothetical protein